MLIFKPKSIECNKKLKKNWLELFSSIVYLSLIWIWLILTIVRR